MTIRSKKQDDVNNVTTCKDATSLILEYLNGDLNEDDNHNFEKHLRDCPDCVAFLNTYKKTIELTNQLLRRK